MGAWLTAIITGMGLAREIFKYLNAREENKHAATDKMRALRDAMKKRDTNEVHNVLSSVGLGGPAKSVSDDGADVDA